MVERDLVWDDRRKPGGARIIAYAGPRASSTRFGAGLLFAISSLAFVWLIHKHISEQPPWVFVIVALGFFAGAAVAAVSWPGSSRGRLEIAGGKLRFVSRGLFEGDIELAAAQIASFTSDTVESATCRVYAAMHSGVRVKLATYGTLDAANEMVRELEQALAWARA